MLNNRKIFIAVLIFILSIFLSSAYALDNEWDTYPITSDVAESLGLVWYEKDGSIVIGSSDDATSIPDSHALISGALHIPSSIDGKRVVGIGPYAFYGNMKILSLTIPKSINSIGIYAFSECTNIGQIYFAEGISEISNGAFKNCSSLSYVVTPSSLKSIKDEAFSDCAGMTNLYFRNGLESIGAKSFSNCTGLKSLYIPNSVTSISRNALTGDGNITELNFQGKSGSVRFYPFGASNATTYWNKEDPGYDDSFNDSYEVTVPTSMEVGKEYSISAKGKIRFGKRLGITCDNTVSLKEISTGEILELDIDYSGLSLFGENNNEVSSSASILVNNPEAEVGGTFKGIIVYDIKLFD